MPLACSAHVIACPNKIRGVYSRPALGRVLWAGRGAVWRIFPGGGRIGGAIGAALVRRIGAKVGREKSVDASISHAFPPFFGADPLMGRWRGAVSASGRGRPGAPLGVAASSGYPVAQSGPEIWKISARSAAIFKFLTCARAPNENPAQNGSGCAGSIRHFSVKRVGDRLLIAGKAWIASILGLSGPGLECVTLCGGVGCVN